MNATNLVNKWNTMTFTQTTTTLNLSPTSITHGQPVNVSAAVAPKSGPGTPTGDISLLTSNNHAPGFFTLSGGSVSSTISSLPGGTYTVTAQYGGDGTFAPSTSAPTPTLSVSQENSITTVSAYTLNSSLNFVPFTGGPYGSFVYLRADVTGQSGNGTPTGTLTFDDNGHQIVDTGFSLNSQGETATPNFLNSPIGGTPTGLFTLSPGAHSMTGSYFGDISFLGSTSTPVNLSITQAPTTAVAGFSPQPQGATLTATVNTSSGGTPPSGTVTFFVNGSQVGNPVAVTQVPALTALNGTLQGTQATASYTDTALVNGTPYTLKASYKGDTNYLTSTSQSVHLTLQSDFSFTESQNELDITAPGSNGALTLTVTALDGYTGTVSFSSSSCSGLPAGAACGFNPSSIKGSGTTTLKITTTKAAAASMLTPISTDGLGLWAAFSIAGLVGFVWIGVPTRQKRSFSLLAILLCALMITGVGCGGGGSSAPAPATTSPPPLPPTPAGVYNVVVTAASGSLTHKVAFTLVVE